MAAVRPFRGIRYSAGAELASLVCPPYDVISASEQDALHDLHPHNAVRLERAKPRDGRDGRYAGVGDTFRRWLAEGILRRDEHDAYYMYRQDFRTADESLSRVAGVIGALELEEFGPRSDVLPHEQTMEGPKDDRLALMRELPANVSPIYAVYRGGGGLRPYFDSLEDRPPTARFADADGTLHRLWAVGAAGEVRMIDEALAREPLVIADGHHRYETALAFHREQTGPAGDHGSIMSFCVDADVEDVVVLPYHRALRAEATTEELERRLDERGAETVAHDRALAALESGGPGHRFAFVLPDGCRLTEVREEEVVERLGGRPRAWRALDVVALHEILLPELFPGGATELRFSRDAGEMIRAVRSDGWTTAVLMRALSAVDVVEAALSGERMPQKASYFWPKAVTGLVFRSLR